MRCDEFMEDLLISYLFGELDRERRESVERHLASCSNCRRTAAELRATVGLLREWGDEEVGDWASLPPVAPAARRRRGLVLFLKGLAWAAAAALVILALSRATVTFRHGELTISFAGGGRARTAAGQGGLPGAAPTERARLTADSGSSTHPATASSVSGQRYASLRDLELAQRRSLDVVESMLRRSELRQARMWKRNVEYLLDYMERQRRRDLADLMMRIEQVGSGAYQGIQMANLRLKRLESGMRGVKTGAGPESGERRR